MVVLASCDLRERSYEMADKGHGAYTYFLIEALKGAADRDGDGTLGAHEVYLYAWEQTRRWAATRGLSQTPKWVSAVSGDIVLGRAPRRVEPPDASSLAPRVGRDAAWLRGHAPFPGRSGAGGRTPPAGRDGTAPRR